MDDDIKALLLSLQSRLNSLEDENKVLKERLDKTTSPEYSDSIPYHLRVSDPKIGGVSSRDFARRVVVVTTPGAAEDYANYAGLDVVDAGGLVQNSKSNPIRD